MSFHVGMLVVCVDVSPDLLGRQPTSLQKGAVYTVRGLRWSVFWAHEQVLLSEIVQQPRSFLDGTYENGWGTWRFRPVDEARIEIFRKIAVSPRQEVDA